MCSPKISLTALQIKRRKYYKNFLLNDVDKIFPIDQSDINFQRCTGRFVTEIKKTEYKYVSLVVYKGVQTYRAHIPELGDFKKFSPSCKDLAKIVDLKFIENGKDPVNILKKPETKK